MDRGADAARHGWSRTCCCSRRSATRDTPIIPCRVDLRGVVDEVIDLVVGRRPTQGARPRRGAPGRAGRGPRRRRGARPARAPTWSATRSSTPPTGAGSRSASARGRPGTCSRCTDEGIGISAADQEHLFASSSGPPTPRRSPSPAPASGWRSCSGSSSVTAAGIEVELRARPRQHVHRHAAGRRAGPSRRRSALRGCASSSASASTTRSNSARWRPSLAPWARVSGSSTPVTSTLASRERLEELGDERDRAADAHVDRLGAVPGLGERGAGGVVRRTGGVDLRWPRRCRRP